jgi:CubicO group peptidase (beta-lactamase class C family)
VADGQRGYVAVMHVDGRADEGFGAVVDAFERNFSEHGDLGAAFALHVGGRLKVDIRAGVADRRDGSPWTDRTLQLVFSTTKGVAAVCVAMLVDRGRIRLDAPVAEYWPEFGTAGKEAVTVSQMMSHQAGVPALDRRVSLDEALAVRPVVEAIAAQEPLWEPGSAHGYHALTYGWMVGELVRRVDGRSLNRFLQDEVCRPLGVEFWMGLPEDEEPRVAHLEAAPRPTGAALEMALRVAGPGTLGGRALTLDGAFGPVAGPDMSWNTRAVHASEIPAANGITDARSLSAIYAATVSEVDGCRLLGPATVEAMTTEQVHGPDRCLVVDSRFATGFMLHGTLTPMLGEGSFGHAGAGGSLGYADPDAGIGYGYVMNQMGGGIAGDPRTVALTDAVRSCL